MIESDYIPHDATVIPKTPDKSTDFKFLVENLTIDYQMFYHSYCANFPLFNCVQTKHTQELFIGGEDGYLIKFDLKILKEISSFKYHTKGIINLKISASENYLLSASHDCSIGIFDILYSQFLKSIDISPAVPEAICFTENEDIVCIGSKDSTIRVWNFKKSDSPSLLLGHTDAIMTLRPLNKNLIISSSVDKTLKIWDFNLLTEICSLKGHKSWINCFILSNKKDIIISGAGDNTLRTWNVKNFSEMDCLYGHTGEIYALAISSDDSLVASGSQDKTVRVWNLKNKLVIYIQDTHSSYVTYVKITPDSNLLISSSYRNIIVDNLIDKRTEVLLEGHTGLITHIELSHDGKSIISTSFDKTLKLWHINNKEVKTSLNSHTASISCLAVTHDSKYIISGSWDCMIIIWNFKEKKPIHILKSHTHYVSCIEQTSDSRRFLSGSWDSTIKLWELHSGILLHTFTGPEFNIYAIRISSFSDFFISISGDFKARFWSLENFSELYCLNYTDAISSLFITPNDLATLSNLDGTLQTFNPSANVIENTFKFDCAIYGFRFFDGFNKLVICLNDKSIRIWDFLRFSEIGIIKDHRSKWPSFMSVISNRFVSIVTGECEFKIFNVVKCIESVCFKVDSAIGCCAVSGCGEFCVAGSKSGDIFVWNLREKRIELNFKGHTDQIESMDFIDGSRYLITGSRDTTIKVWRFYEFLRDYHTHSVDETVEYSFNDPHNELHIVHPKKDCTHPYDGFEGTERLYPPLTYMGFRQRFSKKLLPVPNDCKIVLQGGVNLAHLYSYLGYYKHLHQALHYNCLIRRDNSKNSPLHYAIVKDSEKSADIILEYMINLSKNEEGVQKYFEYNYALRDDLYKVIKLSSSLVPLYLESIFIVSKDKSLPNSLRCLVPPVILFSRSSKISFESFRNKCSNFKINTKYESFVDFRTTPIKLILSNGSAGCFHLFRSLAYSRNQKVFSTILIRTILDYKFRLFYKIICLLSFILFVDLLLMITCIIDSDTQFSVHFLYLLINIFMLIHEGLQLKYEGLRVYVRCKRNLLDIFSVLLSTIWIFSKFGGNDITVIKWLMVFSNFIKGLNIFKTFNATRFYMGLLIRAIIETYSFLIIFCYSTLAFGALYVASVGNTDSPFIMLWRVPYELNFGVFNSVDDLSIEYLYFILASLLNIVMMLNLLIAILGDSFDKFQIEALELDYKEKLDVILEIECLFVLLNTRKRKGFFQLCDYDSKDNEEEPWGGKIKEIEMKVGKISKAIDEKFKAMESNHLEAMGVFSRIEKKLDKLLIPNKD